MNELDKPCQECEELNDTILQMAEVITVERAYVKTYRDIHVKQLEINRKLQAENVRLSKLPYAKRIIKAEQKLEALQKIIPDCLLNHQVSTKCKECLWSLPCFSHTPISILDEEVLGDES